MPALLRQILLGLNRRLEQFMFLLVLIGMAIGWGVPALAAWKPSVSYLFGLMTFATALNTSWRQILAVVRLPGPILRILGLLHGFMPLVALALGRLILGSSSPFAVGLVLAAIVPIGVTSVIWTGMARGEVPLALTAVTIDSLLSPLLVPLSVWLFLGHTVQFDAKGLFIGLFLMIVLPTAAAISLRDLTGGRLGTALAPVSGSLAKLLLILVVAINVAAARDLVAGQWSILLPLIVLLFVQAFLGYLVGFGGAKAFGYDAPKAAAMTFSVGMRNISAGIVLAMQYFSPQATVAVVLALLFQQPLASVFYRRLTGHGKAAQSLVPATAQGGGKG